MGRAENEQQQRKTSKRASTSSNTTNVKEGREWVHEQRWHHTERARGEGNENKTSKNVHYACVGYKYTCALVFGLTRYLVPGARAK